MFYNMFGGRPGGTTRVVFTGPGEGFLVAQFDDRCACGGGNLWMYVATR